MKTFILTEKREAGFQLASALPSNEFTQPLNELENISKTQKYLESSNYIISWGAGHLFRELMPEEINASFGFNKGNGDYESFRMEGLLAGIKKTESDDTYKQSQLFILKKQLNRTDISTIWIATDADAEGEAIARDILTLKKNLKNVDILRFWNTGSFKSKEAVEKAIKKLEPYNSLKYENLYHSQLARSKADYLLGLKLSRVVVESYNKSYFCGRVKGVIVGLVGNRENEINNFKPKEYYSLSGFVSGIEFSHFYYYEDEDKKVKEQHYFDKEKIEKVIEEIANDHNEVEVVSFDTTQSISKKRPLPLSGSAFASEMMGVHNISYDEANAILDYLRSEGFSTYPGTNGSVYAYSDSPDVKDALNTANAYFKKSGKFTEDSYIFNDKKAEKQNHPPLSPTSKIPTSADIEKWQKHKLPKIKEAYELIASRILVAFLEDDLIEKQNLVVSSVHSKHLFDLNGRKAIKQGWRSFLGKEIKDTTFNIADNLNVGDIFSLEETQIKTSTTKPASLYTVKSLLDALCNITRVIDKLLKESVLPEEKEKFKLIKSHLKNAEGIGTDRTRATIINSLSESKNKNDIPPLAINKKGQITLSDTGIEQFHIYPPDIKSVITTAQWENSFEEIRRGELDYLEFLNLTDQHLMDKSIAHVFNNVGVIVKPKVIKRDLIESFSCPLCGSQVFETMNSYTCNENKFVNNQQSGCKFSITKSKEKIFGRDLEGSQDIINLCKSSKNNPLKENKHSIYFDIESQYFVSVSWDNEVTAKQLFSTNKTFKLGDKYIFKNFRGKNLTESQAHKILNGEIVKITRTNKNKKKYSMNVSYKPGGGELHAEFA